jgi:hypothetical protein
MYVCMDACISISHPFLFLFICSCLSSSSPPIFMPLILSIHISSPSLHLTPLHSTPLHFHSLLHSHLQTSLNLHTQIHLISISSSSLHFIHISISFSISSNSYLHIPSPKLNSTQLKCMYSITSPISILSSSFSSVNCMQSVSFPLPLHFLPHPTLYPPFTLTNILSSSHPSPLQSYPLQSFPI